MDITIQRGDFLPELKRCSECCSKFHCPFCAPKFFQPTNLSKVQKHLKGHFNRSIEHEGNITKLIYLLKDHEAIKRQSSAVVFQDLPFTDVVSSAECSTITIVRSVTQQSYERQISLHT